LALQVILLQNLVYVGLRVQWTFWLCPLLGGLTWYVSGRDLLEGWRSSPALRRESIVMGFILVFIFVAQSISAVWAGHDNYYGLAHIDHFNYTITSEYLRHAEFGGAGQDPQDTVWLLKVNQTREQRLGQSILQAYLGAVSFTSTKDAYAGAVAFCVSLLALGAYGIARSVSLSRPYAMGAALWTGLAPGITQMHLDGFMSQSCSAFVFPWLMLLPRLRIPLRGFLILSGIPLALLLVTYTEVYPIGIAVFGLATVASQGISIRSIGSVLGSVLLSSVILPAYLPRAISFMTTQYATASAKAPQLEVLAPDAGTVFGWVSILLNVPLVSPGLEYRILVFLGLALIVSCAAGLFSSSLRNRVYLGAITAGAWLFLSILLSNPDFVRYPYQKILVTFAFLWIVLSVCGIAHTARWLQRLRVPMIRPAFVFGTFAVLFLLASAGYIRHHLGVFRQDGMLQVLGNPTLREAFRFASTHPSATYLIKESDGMVAAWLAYHTFHSKSYYDAPSLSDLPIPSGLFRFSTPPADLQPTLISRNGIRDASTRLPIPDILVSNPQGQDVAGSSVWYWLGDALTIEVGRWDGSTTPKTVTLSFTAEPGPANPSPNRSFNVISARDASLTKVEITGTKTVKVPVVLYPGLNKLQVESVDPIEHVVKLPGDARKHLTRLSNFSTSEGGSAPLSVAASQPSAGATPEVTVVNPQGKDGSGDKFWYWVGREAQLQVPLSPDSPDRAFRLKLRAEAGPANPNPARKIRLRRVGQKFERVYSFNGVTLVDVVIPVTPGENTYLLEALEPTVQTVKIPGDARNHMVRVSDISIARVKVMPTAPGGK
jgi:hypothetical protein